MTHPPAPRRRTLRRAGAAVAALIGLAAGMLALALGSAGAASASLGSVPAEVSAYVSSGAMVTRLNDVYGPNASGTAGIKFDDTTKPGPIIRVYDWTAARLANQPTDHPVQLSNNWVVPITIGGKSVGLATIWINPQTVAPELADFAPSAALGTALTTVPATAALVRDTAAGAWLALSDGKVMPLVAGRSGLTAPVPVGSLKLSPAAPTPLTTTEPNTGLALAIGLVGLIVVIIVAALVLPRGRRAKKKTVLSAVATVPQAGPDAAPDAASESATLVEVAAPMPMPAPATAAKLPAAKSPPARPPSVRSPAPKPPAVTPTAARSGRRTPTTSSAAKPASSKPAASRPARSGPPVAKPPAPKQPPRPRPAKAKAPHPPPSGSGVDGESGPEA